MSKVKSLLALKYERNYHSTVGHLFTNIFRNFSIHKINSTLPLSVLFEYYGRYTIEEFSILCLRNKR